MSKIHLNINHDHVAYVLKTRSFLCIGEDVRRTTVKWCDQERQQRSAQTMMLWRWRQRSAA